MLEKENILVVYYSYTNNTRKLANQIHENIGGDIIEIQLVMPYSDDYDEVEEQVLREQEENYRPEINTKIDNIESYDVILIGSPIWWFEIAPPLKTFLAANDLSGKTVALFTTHEWWLWPGKSDDNIKELCLQSNVLKSFVVKGEDVDSAQKEVLKWLHEIRIIKQ